MGADSPVLLCTDFSAASHRALELASAVCARIGAPLKLVHVWNANHLAGSGGVLRQLEDWIVDQKEHLAGKLYRWAIDCVDPSVELSTQIVEGAASREIPRVAAAAHAQLVVMGRRGSANLSHILLGSVTERVVHQSLLPVLVVPERCKNAGLPQRLLVGIDFSEPSRDAYRVALDLAERFGARGIQLVHVAPTLQDIWGPDVGDVGYPGAYPYDQASLERWARIHHERGVQIEARVVAGRTEEVLLSTAELEGCDWLVLGREGRSGLASFLLGSTSDRTLKRSDRPVLVVTRTSTVTGESTG